MGSACWICFSKRVARMSCSFDRRGDAGYDTLRGDDGDDTLRAGEGNDQAWAGDGNDEIYGEYANDSIGGGTGNDTLGGGTGADRIVFADGWGQDRVVGFADNVDTLALNDNLWTGTLTVGQVISTFATAASGNTVFDFGGGDTLTVVGIGNPWDLWDDIDIV